VDLGALAEVGFGILTAKQASSRRSSGPDADPRRKAADAVANGANSGQKKVRIGVGVHGSGLGLIHEAQSRGFTDHVTGSSAADSMQGRCLPS